MDISLRSHELPPSIQDTNNNNKKTDQEILQGECNEWGTAVCETMYKIRRISTLTDHYPTDLINTKESQYRALAGNPEAQRKLRNEINELKYEPKLTYKNETLSVEYKRTIVPLRFTLRNQRKHLHECMKKIQQYVEKGINRIQTADETIPIARILLDFVEDYDLEVISRDFNKEQKKLWGEVYAQALGSKYVDKLKQLSNFLKKFPSDPEILLLAGWIQDTQRGIIASEGQELKSRLHLLDRKIARLQKSKKLTDAQKTRRKEKLEKERQNLIGLFFAKFGPSFNGLSYPLREKMLNNLLDGQSPFYVESLGNIHQFDDAFQIATERLNLVMGDLKKFEKNPQVFFDIAKRTEYNLLMTQGTFKAEGLVMDVVKKLASNTLLLLMRTKSDDLVKAQELCAQLSQILPKEGSEELSIDWDSVHGILLKLSQLVCTEEAFWKQSENISNGYQF